MLKLICKCIQSVALAYMIYLGFHIFKVCASIVDIIKVILTPDVTFLMLVEIVGWLLLFALAGIIGIFFIIFAANLFSYIWAKDNEESNEDN